MNVTNENLAEGVQMEAQETQIEAQNANEITVNPTDLPIDITAIGRQDVRTTHITTRIGAHLFTDDAARVNYALTDRIRQRQGTALYLFENVYFNYEIDPHARILSASTDLALFNHPTNFSSINTTQHVEELSSWILVALIAVSAVIGFIWAIYSKAKKRRKEADVY